VKRAYIVLAAIALAIGACGGDGGSKGDSGERADAAVEPPRGWRTVTNDDAGFSVAVPRRWSAHARGSATVLHAPDKLDVITVAADRGEEGRTVDAADYARQTLEALPDFEGSLTPTAKRIRGSPYRSARLDGEGSLKTSRRPDRITVVAFQRPGRVTYVAVIFRNPRIDPRYDEPRLGRILRSFRARPRREG
jgi:hypothetical protein